MFGHSDALARSLIIERCTVTSVCIELRSGPARSHEGKHPLLRAPHCGALLLRATLYAPALAATPPGRRHHRLRVPVANPRGPNSAGTRLLHSRPSKPARHHRPLFPNPQSHLCLRLLLLPRAYHVYPRLVAPAATHHRRPDTGGAVAPGIRSPRSQVWRRIPGLSGADLVLRQAT